MNATTRSLFNGSTTTAAASSFGKDNESFVEGDVDAVAQSLHQAANMLYWVCSPVIVALGTVGNVLTVLVMRNMSVGLSGFSMSVFFAALAVSDLIILYTGLLRLWLAVTFNFELMNMHDIFCRLFMFLVYTCGMTSSWFLVSMTLQRVTSVMFPHRTGVLCTRRKAQVVLAAIVLLFILLNIHILYGFTVNVYDDYGPICDYVEDDFLIHYDLNVYPWLDLTFTSVLPFALLVVGNSLLVGKVVQSLRVARQMTSSDTNQIAGREKKASSLTITVICMSATFVCLTLPICVYMILHSAYFPTEDSADARYLAIHEVVFAVCRLLWYANSAVNFYLYCLTGSKFRSQLRRLLCGRVVAKRETVATSVASISMTMASSRTKVSVVKDDVRC